MRFDAISVIPEVFSGYVGASILGRAQARGVFTFHAHDLRTWTHDRHRTVDDAPFGGGQGMLMKPEQYDVVVTTNMFGDILSDEAAGLVGGLGMAPGLCIGPDYCMAQATHGSAPDIAGKNIANPYAMIESARMMLSWIAEKKQDADGIAAAEDIRRALLRVVRERTDVTPDLGGTGTTTSMGEAVCRAIAEG